MSRSIRTGCDCYFRYGLPNPLCSPDAVLTLVELFNCIVFYECIVNTIGRWLGYANPNTNTFVRWQKMHLFHLVTSAQTSVDWLFQLQSFRVYVKKTVE